MDGPGSVREAGAMARSFSDLSPAAQRVAALTGVVQVAMLVAAQVDLARRADHEVRGPRRVWQAVVLVNVVGPLAYWRWGRLPRG